MPKLGHAHNESPAPTQWQWEAPQRLPQQQQQQPRHPSTHLTMLYRKAMHSNATPAKMMSADSSWAGINGVPRASAEVPLNPEPKSRLWHSPYRLLSRSPLQSLYPLASVRTRHSQVLSPYLHIVSQYLPCLVTVCGRVAQVARPQRALAKRPAQASATCGRAAYQPSHSRSSLALIFVLQGWHSYGNTSCSKFSSWAA